MRAWPRALVRCHQCVARARQGARDGAQGLRGSASSHSGQMGGAW